MSVQSAILQNTDLVFLLSDYMNDSSAKEFFNCQRQYREMLEKFPKRYQKKKQRCYDELVAMLEKVDGHIWHVSSKKTVLFINFKINIDQQEWNENCTVDMENDEICFGTDQCMLAWFKGDRHYKSNVELLRAFKNFFEC
jgi:hypothetical protein